MRRALVVLAMATAAIAAVPATAGADGFTPTPVTPEDYEDLVDDLGHKYKFKGRALGSAFSEHLQYGGAMEFSKYETDLVGLPGIQIKSYDFRGEFRLVAFPNRLSPYCGGGVWIDVLRLDADAVENVITSLQVDNFEIQLSGLLFAGVQLPVTDELLLFTEARLGGVADVIDRSSVQMGIGPLEGYGGYAGMRMRF